MHRAHWGGGGGRGFSEKTERLVLETRILIVALRLCRLALSTSLDSELCSRTQLALNLRSLPSLLPPSLRNWVWGPPWAYQCFRCIHNFSFILVHSSNSQISLGNWQAGNYRPILQMRNLSFMELKCIIQFLGNESSEAGLVADALLSEHAKFLELRH